MCVCACACLMLVDLRDLIVCVSGSVFVTNLNVFFYFIPVVYCYLSCLFYLSPSGIDPETALSICGLNGLTAYFGLLHVGALKEVREINMKNKKFILKILRLSLINVFLLIFCLTFLG